MTTALPLASMYFLAALTGLGLVLRISRDTSPVARELMGLGIAVITWSLFYGLETLATAHTLRQLWSQFAYVGIYGASAFLIRFSVRWLRPRLQGWWLNLVWVVPAFMVVAAFTNGLHGLVWPEIRASDQMAYVWIYSHGPVFWFGAAYQYFTIAVSVALLVVAIWTHKGIYRSQAVYVVIGISISAAGNLAYLTGILPIPLDITPIALAISTGVMYAGITRGRMLEVLPAARHRVMDLVPDGLLILDTDMRIVDWNASALTMWKAQSPNLTGTPVSELIRPWDEQIAPGLEEAPSGVYRKTLVVPGESMLRTYIDVEVRPFSIRSRRTDGWIVMVRDASLARRTERELQAANERLEALNKMLLSQAIHDSLTGLFNRAYLDEALPRELARCVRDGSSIGLLILDVDHFKDVNDTYGHDIGDRVLKEVARLVKSVVRAGDIPCRFGGDEIVAVMPGADGPEAASVAERVRELVSAMQFSAEGVRLFVTVSVGVAIFPDHAESAADLFRMADRALYSAKDQGRNRTVTAAD